MSAHTAAGDDRESLAPAEAKLELRVWLRLLTCATLIEQRVRSRLRTRFDTTLPRFDLLAQLERAPKGLTMGELSSRLMVSNGNVTGLADRLVQEGLAARAAKPRDRRAQLLRLTPKGRRAFDGMTPDHEAWIGEMLAGLSAPEMHGLLALLGKLKESLNANQDDGRKP